MVFLHLGQKDLGDIIDKLLGIRKITTLIKLPKHRPNTPINIKSKAYKLCVLHHFSTKTENWKVSYNNYNTNNRTYSNN